MTTPVDWILQLVDRVSAPAQRMERQLMRIERTMIRVERATQSMSRAANDAAVQQERAASRTARAWGGVTGVLQRVRTGALRVGAVGLGVGLTAGYAGKKIVDAAAYKQDQLTSFSAQLGSKEKGAALYKRASRFAAATPFTTRQVIDASGQVLSGGFKDNDVIPVIKLAGSLASGANKPLEQVIRAFGALRSGDYGEAFGSGMGFRALNISKTQLEAQGLKFDKIGSYQGNEAQGLAAVKKIIEQQYGKAMEAQGKNISGLASTLASKPQELFESLINDDGSSKALAPLQKFMANLAVLTDFEKGPGKRIQEKFQKSMEGLFGAVFTPLANATGGMAGEKLVNAMLDKLDEFSAWWAKAGPNIMAMLDGVAGAFALLGRVIMFSVRPIRNLLRFLRIIGDDEQTGLATFAGYLIGGAFALKIFGMGLMFLLGPLPAIFRLFGLVMLLNTALPMLAANGVINAVWLARLQNIMRVITPIVRVFTILLGGWQGALLGIGLGIKTLITGSLIPWITATYAAAAAQTASLYGVAAAWVMARVAAMQSALTIAGAWLIALGPVGWIIAAVGVLIGLGVLLYKKYKPFRDLINGMWDGMKKGGKAVGDWLSAGWGKFEGAVNRANVSVNSWFAALPERIGGFFSSLPEKIAGFFNAIPGKLANLGANLYNAILPQWVRDALSNVGINVPNPASAVPVSAPAAVPVGSQASSITALSGVAQRLGIDPQALLAVAFKESSLNAGAINPDSGASGLIQFTRSTAASYGYTLDQIRGMGAEQQAPLIQRYLTDRGVRSGMGIEQIYAAVFGGNANRAGRTLYTRADGAAYTDNEGLDLNKDGSITSAEAAQSALAAFKSSGLTVNQTFVFQGPVTPAGVTAAGLATQNGVLAAQASQNAEAGGGARR
jgi:hypothetical protein